MQIARCATFYFIGTRTKRNYLTLVSIETYFTLTVPLSLSLKTFLRQDRDRNIMKEERTKEKLINRKRERKREKAKDKDKNE